MGEKKLHIQSRVESHCKEGLKKFQTNLLGFEIRDITKRKICQVLMEMYRDIFKEHQT
jgi:hypothetical protein